MELQLDLVPILPQLELELNSVPFQKELLQPHFGPQFAFRHFDLQIETQIWAQRRRRVIPHLKPIVNTSKLMIEIQIERKWYIFLGVQQFRQIAALKRKLR